MNWRRGLLRVCLVVSLGWIGFVTWTFYETVRAPRRAAAVASDCAMQGRQILLWAYSSRAGELTIPASTVLGEHPSQNNQD